MKLKLKLAIVLTSLGMVANIYAIPPWLKFGCADAIGAYEGGVVGTGILPGWGTAGGAILGGALASCAAASPQSKEPLPTRISGAFKDSKFDFAGEEHNKLLVALIDQASTGKKVDLKSAVLASGLNKEYLKIVPQLGEAKIASKYSSWAKSFSREQYINEMSKQLPEGVNGADFADKFKIILSQESPGKFIDLLKKYESDLKPVNEKNTDDSRFRMFLSVLRHSSAYWSQYREYSVTSNGEANRCEHGKVFDSCPTCSKVDKKSEARVIDDGGPLGKCPHGVSRTATCYKCGHELEKKSNDSNKKAN